MRKSKPTCLTQIGRVAITKMTKRIIKTNNVKGSIETTVWLWLPNITILRV